MALRGTQLKLRGSQTIGVVGLRKARPKTKLSVLSWHLTQKAGVW